MSPRSAYKPLTTKQVADRLGVSEITVRNWRLRNQGPKYTAEQVGMGWRVSYQPSDVDEFRKNVLDKSRRRK